MEKQRLDEIYEMLTGGEHGFEIKKEDLESVVERAELAEARTGAGFEIDDSSVSFKLKDLNTQINVSIFDICEMDEDFAEAANAGIDFIENLIAAGGDIEDEVNHWEAYDGIDEEFRGDAHYCYWKLDTRTARAAASA